MKNINSIISGLSRSGLLSRTARGRPHRSLKRTFTDTVIATATGKKWSNPKQNIQQTGALATVGRMAWDAYQSYSQQAYGLNTSLQKANLQRAYMQGVYAQRNVQQKAHEPSQPKNVKIEPTPTSQSRYIPSTNQPSLTYSPSSLSKQQFEQVVQDDNHDSGQMLILQAMITAANADGHIDENERQLIYQQVDDFDLNNEDKANLFDELRHPLSLQELVKAVPNSQTAIEVYAASLLAIDEQQPDSQSYLSSLSTALLIPLELVEAVHGQAKEIS
jgi:uncharacterized membrane protein YebE (DUF533 family)